jgi:hypothetical protein
LAIHIDCSDAHVATGLCRDGDLAPTILRAIDLIYSHPTLIILYALSN